MSVPTIKKLRKALGLSQEAFAQAIGKSYPSIRNYEDGRKLPPDVMGRMLFLATRAGLGDLALEIEHVATEWYDQPIQPTIPDKFEGPTLTTKERRRLHSLLDYVLDAVGPDTVKSLEEILRVYSVAARCMGDPFIDLPKEFEGPTSRTKSR